MAAETTAAGNCEADLGHARPQGRLERSHDMGSVNKVILVGNLGRDSELRIHAGRRARWPR